jgi:hypothetical protein
MRRVSDAMKTMLGNFIPSLRDGLFTENANPGLERPG